MPTELLVVSNHIFAGENGFYPPRPCSVSLRAPCIFGSFLNSGRSLHFRSPKAHSGWLHHMKSNTSNVASMIPTMMKPVICAMFTTTGLKKTSSCVLGRPASSGTKDSSASDSFSSFSTRFKCCSLRSIPCDFRFSVKCQYQVLSSKITRGTTPKAGSRRRRELSRAGLDAQWSERWPSVPSWNSRNIAAVLWRGVPPGLSMNFSFLLDPVGESFFLALSELEC
jgi:hypothetical protein